MASYFLFDNLKITDEKKLNEYKDSVGPVVQQFGGEYVVLGGEHTVMEGDWQPTFLIMIKFPDADSANGWYYSKEYSELKALRQSAVLCNAVLIKGLG